MGCGSSAPMRSESPVPSETDADAPGLDLNVSDSMGREGSRKGCLPFLDQAGITVPPFPGDIALCGRLKADQVSRVAPALKSWVSLNGANDIGYLRDLAESAGVQEVQTRSFPGPPLKPSTHEVAAALNVLDTLPRPMILQSTDASHAAALLLLWLVSRHGHSATAARRLAMDIGIDFWQLCNSQAMGEWVLKRLPDVSSVGALRKPADGVMLVQLFDAETSTFTYLVGCEASKSAVLIDPVISCKQRDIDLVEKLGLTLKYALDTHCHEDHVTSAGRLGSEIGGVRTVISNASGASADVCVENGDTLDIGNLSLKALATPGHSDGCFSWLLAAPGSAGHLVFTGHSLLVRSCGRTDIQQGDAGKLFDSVHSTLFQLPGDTVVYPGHACEGRNVSTIEEERRFNVPLRGTRTEFIKFMSEINQPEVASEDQIFGENLRSGVRDMWEQAGMTC